MTTITFNTENGVYNKETKTFTFSEKHVPFDTTYTVVNPKSNDSRKFEFSHSTGPEFDPNTKWIYKSNDGLTLEVINDLNITAARADAYLNAKLSK